MKKMNLVRFVTLAMLLAVALVLGLTNIGIIPIPPANVTTMHIPVIIGTIVCGLGDGMVLGLAFGLVSVWKAFTATSSLVGPLMAESPVLVIIMSVGARLMVPVVTHFVYKAFKKKTVGIAIAAAAGTLTNTVCYLGLMLLFYTLTGLDSGALLGVITGVGALNGSLEAVAAVLLCTPIATAVGKIVNKEVTVEHAKD
ncbi:MAG: ECF transporter S component [Christensenellaceae bacterium]|jgi:uncharacterized membrane protein